MAGLIESPRAAVEDRVDLLGRAGIEAVPRLSAQRVAGGKHQGWQVGKTCWHGSHSGPSASLPEGQQETFALDRLDLSPSPRRYLDTVKFIGNPQFRCPKA